nr:outer membrane autotransporter [uncultured Mediterranean phage uvMED]
MTNTIRIKKRAAGGASGAPSSLAPSELAYSEVDNILSYGFGDAGGGAASSVISIAGSGAFATLTGNQTLSGNKTFTGTVDLSGATLSGNTTFSNNLVVSGDLTVSGTTTTVNSTTVDVADKNITLGNVSTPTDSTADGGGISLKGATDKLFRWLNATDSWTSSEHLDLASGKAYYINGASVLSSTTLGSGVTGSSLTSVGTLSSGTWSASTIAVNKGGTGQTSYTNGQLLIGNTTGNTLAKATLTAGSNITITNSAGGITIAAAAGAPTGGDGIAVSGSEVSVDSKANGGLVIESAKLAVDLGASSITGTLAVGDGGTGATSASAARTALGLAIGSNVQAYDAQLADVAGLAVTNGGFIVGDGSNFVLETGATARTSIGAQTLAADLTNLSSCQSGASAALAALTSTEVAILDGATVTTAELNIIDGGTSATSTTLATADRMVINDAGTMVQVALTDLVTFLENGAVSGFALDGGTF